MNPKDIYIGTSPEEVSKLITNYIIGLAKSLDHSMNIAISGGSTPEMLFQYWLKRPQREFQDLGIRFWWVDERLVPVDSPDSNYGNAKRHFFGPVGYPEDLLFPISFHKDDTPEEAAEKYNELLKKHMESEGRETPFDLVILGVGEDGHTSSLFPGQELYNRQEYYIPSVNPYNGIKRVALSYQGILRAPHVLFHVLGHKKRDILHEVMQRAKEEDFSLPASFVFAKGNDVTLFTDLEV